MLVVKSKIKEVAKGMNVAGNFADALSKFAEGLLKDAEERAKANKRHTVMDKDLALFFLAKKTNANLVVRSKIKEYIKSCNVSSNLSDALNSVLNYLIIEACRRTKENKRSTIQPRDI